MLPGLSQLFHDEGAVGIRAVGHLLVEILQILSGVSHFHAQRLLHLIGRKLMCIGALLGIR